jgi:hypothetical protein
MAKSGQMLMAAARALEYGFTDVDGKQPRLLTLADVVAGAERAGRPSAIRRHLSA